MLENSRDSLGFARLGRGGAATLLLALVSLGGAAAYADGQQCLATVEREVAERYTTIPHIMPEDLQDKLAGREPPLLVDARPEAEYGVGHIPGAVRVDPDAATDRVVRQLAQLAKGREVVVYCSVGVRSSRLAHRVRQPLEQSGALRVVNLTGGAFGWHNRGLPLADRSGATDAVHPFDRHWRRFLDFSDRARMTPRPAPDAPATP